MGSEQFQPEGWINYPSGGGYWLPGYGPDATTQPRIDPMTRIGELEEAIRDAREGLTRIGRLIDQGNTRVARTFVGYAAEDLGAVLRPPAQWTDEQKRHLGLLGIVPTAYMDERLTRLLAIVGELYVRWEPGAETPEERAIYHEAARILFEAHPCDACRVFWSDRGYACPAHRVIFTPGVKA